MTSMLESVWLAIMIAWPAPHVLVARQLPGMPVVSIADKCASVPLTPWDTLRERHDLCEALRGSLAR